MKAVDWTYELQVFGTRPKSLPLDDFGELVRRLADVLGSREQLRFGALRPGSARVLAKVLEPALQDVQVQLLRAKQDEGQAAARVIKLDEFLYSRGWHAELRNQQGAVILVFPGAKLSKPLEDVRIVQQLDTIIGKVIKIGGRDETVPMTLETADGSYVDVTLRGRELARKLAPMLFGTDIRISGLATWRRDAEGAWSCTGMLVDSFDVPDGSPLSEMFASLRELPNNGWSAYSDPIAKWKNLRGEE